MMTTLFIPLKSLQKAGGYKVLRYEDFTLTLHRVAHSGQDYAVKYIETKEKNEEYIVFTIYCKRIYMERFCASAIFAVTLDSNNEDSLLLEQTSSMYFKNSERPIEFSDESIELIEINALKKTNKYR